MLSKKYKIILSLLLMVNLSTEAQVVSPFNHLKVNDSAADYSFVVSGHFHGSSTNQSTFPASSLLANIDTLNALKPNFLMSLGDLFQDVNETYIRHYESSLFSKLTMPLLNVVGNHDLSNGNVYSGKYGPTWSHFKVGTELYILLNTEENDGSIKGEQLSMLQGSLNKDALQGIKNVFIFSHRPVWTESDERYKGLFTANTHSLAGTNFTSDIEPLLKEAGRNVKIYWMAGSMGGGPSSFFYDNGSAAGVTYIITSIRDVERDAVLLTDVKNGNVSFRCLSMTGQELKPLSYYSFDFWKTEVAPESKFNFRMLPYYCKLTLMDSHFWMGAALSLLLYFGMRTIIRRWKRRK